MNSKTLIEQVEPYLSQAFKVLPNRLQDKVSEALSPLCWDELSPSQRSTALAQLEGPARRESEAEFERAFDLVVQLDELQDERERWRSAEAIGVTEMSVRRNTLAELDRDIASLHRQIGELATDEDANAETLLARYRLAIERNGGNPRGVSAAMATEDGITRQAMGRKISRAQERLGMSDDAASKQGNRAKSPSEPGAHPRSSFPANPWISKKNQ